MKLPAQGAIHNSITVLLGPHYPAYVLTDSDKSIMIDAGINLFGPQFLDGLKDTISGLERLEYLLLTHSHYDHLGAMPYLKKKISGLKTAGHGRLDVLLNKASVLGTMNFLSEMQKSFYPDIVFDSEMVIGPCSMDMKLSEGDSIVFGGMRCIVYEVPGHTRDCLAFYVPELKALFPGDAAGLPFGEYGEKIAVQFLSSFDDYIVSLEKMLSMQVEMIGFGHFWVFTGKDAKTFLRKSIQETFAFKDMIVCYLEKTHGDSNNAIDLIMEDKYDKNGIVLQERNAFKMNLTAQVKHIAASGT